MVKYKQTYDDIIENGIAAAKNGKLSLTKIHDLVSKLYPNVSKLTVLRHLNKMKDEGFLDKEKPGQHNEKNYHLTPARIFEWQWFRPIGVESREESSIMETKEKVDKTVCLMTLLRAASGIQRSKVIDKPI